LTGVVARRFFVMKLVATPPSVITRQSLIAVVIQADDGYAGKKYRHPELVSGSHESRVMSLWPEILKQVQDDLQLLRRPVGSSQL
jgi:hypothetical protein